MSKWERVVLGLASAVILALMGTQLLRAHGGGLDSCGGHNDRKNGGYHIHNMSAYCGCHPEEAQCVSKKSAPTAPSPQSSTPQRFSGGGDAESVSALKQRLDGLEARVTILEKAMAAR